MSNKLVLYDLPTRPPTRCWSLNPWKSRLLLNYKGIDYQTEWVEYPHIKPKFMNLIPPNPEPRRFEYSIPVVKFPDGTIVMDSRNIADRIEKDYPNPSIHMDSPYLDKVQGEVLPALMATVPSFVAKMPRYMLNEVALDHWNTTRSAWFGGRHLDQVESEEGGPECYEKARPHLEKLTAWLKENEAGPFFEGKQVTYADFIWVAILKMYKTIDEDVFESFINVSGDADVHRRLFEACSPWMERDNY